MINVYLSPEFFSNVNDPFSALPDTARTAPSADDDRNVESADLVREKRRSRRERRKADPATVAALRAGIDALRAARAKVAREERAREERAALRNDPVWQAQEAEREAERAAARAARAARLAREREAGAKSDALWASRDAMLDALGKPSWRVVVTHEPFPAFGRMVRAYATSGEPEAAREAATMAWTFERFVRWARAKLHERGLARHERAVLERLMSSDPEAFAAHSVLARTIMDE
jgi:hypothetical protein